jgi:hypothetical protein
MVINFTNNKTARVRKYVIIFHTRVQNIVIRNSAVTINISEIYILLYPWPSCRPTTAMRLSSFYETCWAEFLLCYDLTLTDYRDVWLRSKNLNIIYFYKGMVWNGASPCPFR